MEKKNKESSPWDSDEWPQEGNLREPRQIRQRTETEMTALCSDCEKPIASAIYNNRCYACNQKKKEAACTNTCSVCAKPCPSQFDTCYSCKTSKKDAPTSGSAKEASTVEYAKKCTGCKKPCPQQYDTCYTCKFPNTCDQCGAKCAKAYSTCYPCSNKQRAKENE